MNMKHFLPNLDEDKIQLIKDIKLKIEKNIISIEEANRILKDKINTIKPYELAYIEQNFTKFDPEQCKKEDIQDMLRIYDGILDTNIENLDEDHPIYKYLLENTKIKNVLSNLRKINEDNFIKNQSLELILELLKWRIHLVRKQNQLYPSLEKKGFDRPTTTMWVLDDFVYDEIKKINDLLNSNKIKEFISFIPILVEDILDLINKEEKILYPTSIILLNDEDFNYMKLGDSEIGYSIEGIKNTENNDFIKDLSSLLSKYGFNSNSKDEKLKLNHGEITLEQLNLIFKYLPFDISFVDEKDLVLFYNDTDHRIFPRSRNVIGRNVQNCHPRKSVHIVQEIIDKFRNGEEEKAEFWINKEDTFIYIIYIAIRDENNKFRGILEVM